MNYGIVEKRPTKLIKGSLLELVSPMHFPRTLEGVKMSGFSFMNCAAQVNGIAELVRVGRHVRGDTRKPVAASFWVGDGEVVACFWFGVVVGPGLLCG